MNKYNRTNISSKSEIKAKLQISQDNINYKKVEGGFSLND